MTAAQLAVAFFLQVFVILAAARFVGRLASHVGQPQVVGEMVAGVLIGPSLLGLILPDVQLFLFPPDSLKALYVGAQLGVGLYMFLVGAAFNTDVFLSRARGAAAVSIFGMVVPLALGAGLAVWLVQLPGLFAEAVTPLQAMLFLGAAMAITAFPMLARIIDERGLNGTPLGTLTLAAGAITDAVAWCIFAIVLASIGGGAVVAVKAVGGGIAYCVVVLTLGRKWLTRLGAAADRAGQLTPSLLGTVLMLVMLAAWTTDAIGIHSVFGGFLLGVAMPRGTLTRELQRQLEPFTVVFLLPLFFAFSGLNTRLDMVDNAQMLGVAVVILVAACLGKGVPCWAATRWHGEDQCTALAVGTLMNARGMMELILLNIGLQRGVIQPALFSVMALMAILTTLMASPMFEWVYGRHARATGQLAARVPIND